VINIGGDGSQRISQALFEKGLNIIGVPKTIDNDLSSTDFTFGYQTAVEVATDAVDKLVTTAESHNRMMVRDGGTRAGLHWVQRLREGPTSSDSRDSLQYRERDAED
jgi:hypothetical protein